MPIINIELQTRTLDEIFDKVEDYKRQYAPQGYGTMVDHFGKKEVDGKKMYYVLMHRLSSCD